jgi:small subunit ribosomal protein S16
LAVKLRLKRMGRKKNPFYRIVAADSRAARNGKFIETVGTYDPLANPHKVDYKEDRIIHWLSVGAQPTTTVKSLFRGKGLWLKWTLLKQGADEAKISSELTAWEKIQEDKAKRAEAKKATLAKEKIKKKVEEAKKAEETPQKAVAAVEETVDQAEVPVKEVVEQTEAPETAPAETKAETSQQASAPVEETVEQTEVPVEKVAEQTEAPEAPAAETKAEEDAAPQKAATEPGTEDSEKKSEG